MTRWAVTRGEVSASAVRVPLGGVAYEEVVPYATIEDETSLVVQVTTALVCEATACTPEKVGGVASMTACPAGANAEMFPAISSEATQKYHPPSFICAPPAGMVYEPTGPVVVLNPSLQSEDCDHLST